MKKLTKLFCLMTIFIAGCGNQASVPVPTEPVPKVIAEKQTKSDVVELYYGEAAVFKQYDFTVINSLETDFLKSNNQFEPDLSSSDYSKYVVVDVRYLNTSNETFQGGGQGYWTLTDSRGRNYQNISCSFYSDVCDNYDIYYKPGIPEESQIIFEVAGDSEGYYIADKNSVTGIKYKIKFSEKPVE